MKLTVRLIPVFLLSLLLFLTLNMPAQQLFRFITPPPDLLVQGLEGRVYEGRLRRLEYRGMAFNDLEYRLQPGCFLWLQVCYRLRDKAGLLDLTLGWLPLQGVMLDDARLRLPVSQLQPLMKSLLIQPTGEVEVDIRRLRLVDRRLTELDASAYWRKAGIKGEELVLGDFRAVFTRTEEGVGVQFNDLPGALVGVKGSLQLTNQDYRLDLELEARPGLSEPARNALELVARQKGLNRFSIQNQGSLRNSLFLMDR